jgi:hypothetical protein
VRGPGPGEEGGRAGRRASFGARRASPAEALLAPLASSTHPPLVLQQQLLEVYVPDAARGQAPSGQLQPEQLLGGHPHHELHVAAAAAGVAVHAAVGGGRAGGAARQELVLLLLLLRCVRQRGQVHLQRVVWASAGSGPAAEGCGGQAGRCVGPVPGAVPGVYRACLLPAACCLLPAACCLLPAACCLVSAIAEALEKGVCAGGWCRASCEGAGLAGAASAGSPAAPPAAAAAPRT